MNSDRRSPRSFVGVPVCYPSAYVWFVFFSALDIMLTCIILNLEGGKEVNPIAAAVIEYADLWGIVIFKFSLVILVVFIAEFIGRRNDRLGRRIAEWSVAITCIPVVFSLVLLLKSL